MKLSKQVLSNIFEAAGDFDDANRYADSARKALEAGTLEIEGYERKDHLRDVTKMADEWTKFDSGKGVTYPPEGEEVLAWGLPNPDISNATTLFVCWRSSFGFSCDASAYPEIHFWRPLPPPPTESEK